MAKLTEDQAIELIRHELRKATAKHAPLQSAHEAIAVIEEEFIELRTEVFKGGDQPRNPMAMVKEAKHVGAMAARFLMDVCDTGDVTW